jgi:hypothetical protein
MLVGDNAPMRVRKPWLALGVVVLAGLATAALVWTAAADRPAAGAARLTQAVCALTRADGAVGVRDVAGMTRFAQTDVFYFDKPARIAGWLDEQALAVGLDGARPVRFDLTARALDTRAVVNDPEISRAAELQAAAVALPTPNPAHAYVNGAVRVRPRPGHVGEALLFHSGGAALRITADATACALGVNSDPGGGLPIIAAEWSPDGRRIAFLLQADQARLGPARLRVLDRETLTLSELAVDGPFVATSLAWHPDAKRLLLTVVDDVSAPSLESLALIDVDAWTIDRDAFPGASYFAASHWGAHWSPDGFTLAVACGEPADPEGTLTRGKACLFGEQAR